MEPQIQRWSAKRKVELLLSPIKGERKLVDVCRVRELRAKVGEGVLELDARNKWEALNGRDDTAF